MVFGLKINSWKSFLYGVEFEEITNEFLSGNLLLHASRHNCQLGRESLFLLG